MDNNFKALSISHKNAPIEVRELLSLDESATKSFLQTAKDYYEFNDLLVLSTCNRTEIYYSSPENYSSELLKLVCLEKGITEFDKYLEYVVEVLDESSAVRHLFDVSMGLDSQVIGDIQISNQVKNAYQWSADLQVAGPFLHRLMHSIFFTNKRVVQETAYRDGAASTSFAAVELAEELTRNIINPRILIVGLGEIGKDVVRNFESTKLDNIVLINRTLSKAKELADGLGYRAVPFSEMEQRILEADVIISSIRTEQPFFNKKMLNDIGLEVVAGKFFIDLSVPRSVDREIEDLSGVLVYNIDDLTIKTSKVVEKRKKAIPKVENIIDETLVDFKEWSKEMEVSPTIHKLKNALEEIRKSELAQYVKSMDKEELDRVDAITKKLMQKVIKLPVLQLKAACKRGEAETLIDVLNDLFDLEKQSEKIDRG